MRKIRIFAHISLDGIIAPGGRNEESDYTNGGWTAPFRTPAGAQAVAEAQGSSFDLLLGRRTYDLWSGFWPKAQGGPFAERMNAATKYVATHRPGTLTWGPASDLGEDILAGIQRLKAQDGADLIVSGSTTLTSVLMENGLVDDVVLMVYPVLLGRGKLFFSENADPSELAFVSTKATPTGVLINTYKYVRPFRNRSAS